MMPTHTFKHVNPQPQAIRTMKTSQKSKEAEQSIT
jgi:hypothetical protein